jgi:hypothetical protein
MKMQIIKNKITLMAAPVLLGMFMMVPVLIGMTLVGCQKNNSDENNPAGATNSAASQPMPGAGASTNGMAPGASVGSSTNNPASTNQ